MEYNGNINGSNYTIALDQVNKQIVVHYETARRKAKQKRVFQLYKVPSRGYINMVCTTNENLFRLGLHWDNITKSYIATFSKGEINGAFIDFLKFPQGTIEKLFNN